MARHKRLERHARTVNIDDDLNKILTEKYPNQASDLINESLRLKLSQEAKTKGNLPGFESTAGRLAYKQAMEKLVLPSQTDYKVLDVVDQQRFISVYNSRLVELQKLGF